MNNICIITLDSLRYDVAIKTRRANLLKYGQWEKCGAHGTNTLPAHVALFQGGQVPYSIDKNSRYYYKSFRMFRPELAWDRNRDAVYKVPESLNIVRGFDKLGYYTYGIGGVSWFSNKFQTSGVFWKQFFQKFIWEPEFSEHNKQSFENQLEYLAYHLSEDCDRLFLFINIATTHIPFWQGAGGWRGQMLALKHADAHLPELFSMVPKPCHYIVLADHGTCFAEKDGANYEGHNFVHESVMTVPMMDFFIK